MQTADTKKMLSELLEIAKDFKIVEDIKDPKPPYFPIVLLVILKRDYPILHSINLLKDDEMSGDAIVDLSRRLFEDMISVEYIDLKGKEEYSIRFLKFTYVERWKDFQYLKKIGVEQDKVMGEEIEKEFLLVKDEYMFGKDIAHSWAKRAADKMIEDIVREKKLDQAVLTNLMQGYIVGNKKNHLSSYDAQIFAEKKRRETEMTNAGNVGIRLSLLCYSRILARYSDEANDKKLTDMLKKFISQLF